jgi:hypothetical protein
MHSGLNVRIHFEFLRKLSLVPGNATVELIARGRIDQNIRGRRFNLIPNTEWKPYALRDELLLDIQGKHLWAPYDQWYPWDCSRPNLTSSVEHCWDCSEHIRILLILRRNAGILSDVQDIERPVRTEM